jgi:hypothetical protein
MINQYYNISPRRIAGAICGFVCIFWSNFAHSALLVPTSLSGWISYSYGYNKAQNGAESEAQSITANINTTGYIWQPWFIQSGIGLSFGYSRSSSSTVSEAATGREIGGSLFLNVFPVSRFPFSLTVTHSDTIAGAFAGLSGYESKSTQIFARQSYYPRSGYDSSLSWSQNRTETFSSTSTSNIVIGDVRKSYEKSSWVTSANYSTIDVSDSTTTPENWGLRFNHNYLPGNQASVSSLVNTSGSRTKGDGFSSESQVAQASSAFSWRPEYKPYSFSGGARISAGESRQQRPSESDAVSRSNAANLSLGLNYRLTRKLVLRISGSGSGASAESDSSETTSTAATGSVSTSYASDIYNLGGAEYGWNVGGGVSTTYSDTKSTADAVSTNISTNTSTGSLGASHRISSGWSIGRATSLSASLSQNINGSGTDDGSRGWGTGVGGDISGSSRGISGTSFAGISGSYTYSKTKPEAEEETKLESEFVRATLSRNQNINRLSALTAGATADWRRQLSSGSEGTTTRTANANVNYRHQRFLYVYGLNFDSVASYSVAFNPDEERYTYMEWRNTWRYTIGLLDLALYIDLARQGDAATRGSLRFRATRSF